MYSTVATVDGITAPDSKIARDAVLIADKVLSQPIINHVHRTWWFAELLARKQQLHYDREVVFIASILHDLGLSKTYAGEQRFELDGADAAAEFLRSNNYSEERVELVWDAIAMHSTNGLAERKQPEVALVYLGAHVDVMGLSIEELSPALVDDVLQLYPRLGFKKAFAEALLEATKLKPHVAIGTGAADVLRRLQLPIPNVHDLINGAPFYS